MKPYVKPYLLIAAFILVPACGQAQVTINQAALDQLAGISSPAPTVPPTVKRAGHLVTHRISHKVTRKHLVPKPLIAKTTKPAPAAPATIQTAVAKPSFEAPPPATFSATQPAAAKLPLPKPAPPPPVAAVQPAAPKPVPPPAPVAISFAAGSADLPAAAAATLKLLCANPSGGLIAVDAYAPSDPSDPSAAQILSLNRAFAIRDALTACGVPSARIIPRADGSANSQTPDRATVTPSGGGTEK